MSSTTGSPSTIVTASSNGTYTLNFTSTTGFVLVQVRSSGAGYHYADDIKITNNQPVSTMVYAMDYRYGFNGMEKDDEVKGAGNSYDFGARMHDPRIGRWLTIDPFFSANPTISPYSFASNTPIQAIDKGGLYTIFVNGYIYNKPNTPPTVSPTGIVHHEGVNDDLTPRKPYWQGSPREANEFINAAHDYFGDGIGRYVNGTGENPFSTAEERQEYGRTIGKSLALQVKESIENNEDIKEINFVSHSMGAAVAEGIIEVFMQDPVLRPLVEKGQIVHFSAADADGIVLAEGTEQLERMQLNYVGDKTLSLADPGANLTGGYKIKGVQKMGVVIPEIEKLHPSIKSEKHKKEYDWHFDTKTYADAWKAVKVLSESAGSTIITSDQIIK